jgi:phosphoribosylformylglycinamidine synthase
MAGDAIVAIQDMGAAGLTSSSVEMAGKGELGIELDLDRVPVRESEMSPYEIMLSESQERMLIILKPGRENEARRIFEKWELDFAVIGRVTETGCLVLKMHGQTVAELPVEPLVSQAPLYDRPWIPTPKRPHIAARDVKAPADILMALTILLACPDLASKRWIWEQYDHLVMGDTVQRPGGDAAVVRVRDTRKALALTTDCTPRYCVADPAAGGAQAVAESWRNLTAVGALPIAITDNMNFGNPERPEIMEQLASAIDGIADACRALGVPIVSGNVSLYNETDRKAILPTPTVAAVGLVSKPADVVTAAFKRAGDTVILLGRAVSTGVRALGGSEWLVARTGGLKGEGPEIDLDAEAALQGLDLGLAREGLLQSAHDVSDGGMAATIAECCTVGAEPLGAKVDLPAEGSVVDALGALFGEAPSRVVVSVSAATKDGVLGRAKDAGVPAVVLGTTGGDRLEIAAEPLGKLAVAVHEVVERRTACLRSIVGD